MITWKIKSAVIIFITLFIFGALIASITDDLMDEPNYKIIYKDTCMTPFDTIGENLTKENVYNYILLHNIQFPYIVLKQSILETGWYTSDVCKRDNNLFGFTNDGKKYLKFKDWKQSVRFYKFWQSKYYTGGNYYQFLIDIHYAEDMKEYIKKLKQIKI